MAQPLSPPLLVTASLRKCCYTGESDRAAFAAILAFKYLYGLSMVLVLGKPQKSIFFSGPATKRGGGKVLVAVPLKIIIFCGFPKADR